MRSSLQNQKMIWINEDLLGLLVFLDNHGSLKYYVSDFRAVLKASLDADNLKDPRMFCFTRKGSRVISTTIALADLPLRFRYGILLHEIGHIENNLFGGDEVEPEVDAWAMSVDPGFSYIDVNYTSPWTHETVLARNVEAVSEDLAVALKDYMK